MDFVVIGLKGWPELIEFRKLKMLDFDKIKMLSINHNMINSTWQVSLWAFPYIILKC